MVGRWSAAVTMQVSTRVASWAQAALEGASRESGTFTTGSRSSSGLMMLSVCTPHPPWVLPPPFALQLFTTDNSALSLLFPTHSNYNKEAAERFVVVWLPCLLCLLGALH